MKYFLHGRRLTTGLSDRMPVSPWTLSVAINPVFPAVSDRPCLHRMPRPLISPRPCLGRFAGQFEQGPLVSGFCNEMERTVREDEVELIGALDRILGKPTERPLRLLAALEGVGASAAAHFHAPAAVFISFTNIALSVHSATYCTSPSAAWWGGGRLCTGHDCW